MTITLREMVDREVIYCVSGLVSDLNRMMQHVPGSEQRDLSFDEDDLRNLMVREDWQTPAEWYILNEMDHMEVWTALSEDYDLDEADLERLVLADDLRSRLVQEVADSDGGFKEFCDEHNIAPEQHEAYEHWIVTDWLGAKLKEKGEIVGRLGYLTVWGRCTTGQANSMDWVIQQIYKDLTGQEGEI